jgi:NAD(P)-dependent dehydrogenase (short-subunit alcohol dehydrogenase family)
VKLRDKVVAVTGAGSGLGRQLAIQLLARGARVAAIDLRQSGLDETASIARAGRDTFAGFVVDVTDRLRVDALPAEVIARFGTIDGVINNAGMIQPFVHVSKLEYAAIERVMNVNFFGTLYITKAFLPYLLERPVAHITNVSSMGGFLPVPGQTIYGASKAAVKLFTEGLRSELLSTNVHVTLALPGAMDTNIVVNSQIAMPAVGADKAPMKPLPAADAAKIILDAIERDAARVLVGRDARFMDMLYRLDPRRAAEFIYKQMKSIMPA